MRVLCDEHADGEERNATWVSWGTVAGVEAVKEAEERLGSVKDADLAACDRRVDGPEAGSGGSVRSVLLLPPFLAEGSSWDSCSLKLYLLQSHHFSALRTATQCLPVLLPDFARRPQSERRKPLLPDPAGQLPGAWTCISVLMFH